MTSSSSGWLPFKSKNTAFLVTHALHDLKCGDYEWMLSTGRLSAAEVRVRWGVRTKATGQHLVAFKGGSKGLHGIARMHASPEWIQVSIKKSRAQNTGSKIPRKNAQTGNKTCTKHLFLSRNLARWPFFFVHACNTKCANSNRRFWKKVIQWNFL